MGSLNDRLKKLEAKHTPAWVVPLYARVLCKSGSRFLAEDEGKEPPAYEADELIYLYEADLADARGEGTIAHYRTTPGWQSEDAQRMLDDWQLDAVERVQRVADGASLREVYEIKKGVH